MVHHEKSAQESLSVVAESRAAAADRLITQWWYHPILGALLAGLALAYGWGDTVVRLVGVVVFFAGVVLLITSYQRLTGLWIHGCQSGPASRWAYAMGAVGGLGMGGALALGHADVDRVWVGGLAAVVLVLTIVTGRSYDRSLRAYLRSGR